MDGQMDNEWKDGGWMVNGRVVNGSPLLPVGTHEDHSAHL